MKLNNLHHREKIKKLNHYQIKKKPLEKIMEELHYKIVLQEHAKG